MLIDNVLNLIEEYTSFKQLPTLTKVRKIALARTMTSRQQRADMQNSVKRDGRTIAREFVRHIADSIAPGLGTAGIVVSDVANLIKRTMSRNEKSRESPEIADLVPTSTISTMIKNKVYNVKSQHILDYLKSKEATKIQQGRIQKICARNPGLTGC